MQHATTGERTRIAGILRIAMGMNGVTAHADVSDGRIVLHGSLRSLDVSPSEPGLTLTRDGLVLEGGTWGRVEFVAWRAGHWRRALAEHGWPEPT